MKAIVNVLNFPRFLADTSWYWHEQDGLVPININDE